MDREGVPLADVLDIAIRLGEARSALGRAQMYMRNAEGLLTPGMKAGTAEAKEILKHGIAESAEAFAATAPPRKEEDDIV